MIDRQNGNNKEMGDFAVCRRKSPELNYSLAKICSGILHDFFRIRSVRCSLPAIDVK